MRQMRKVTGKRKGMSQTMKTLIALTLLCVLNLQAQLVMSFTGGNDLSVGPGTAGFGFNVSTDTTIRSLGIWDSDPAAPGLYSSHQVGIWDATTHQLLTSATIPATGAANLNGFWYVNVAPITLQAGHSFVLGASYADSDFDFARGNATLVTTAVNVAIHDAMLSSGTGFEFPDLDVAGANLGFFGPNASISAVPEPSQIAAITALGLLAFGVWRRRFNQRDLCGLVPQAHP